MKNSENLSCKKERIKINLKTLRKEKKLKFFFKKLKRDFWLLKNTDNALNIKKVKKISEDIKTSETFIHNDLKKGKKKMDKMTDDIKTLKLIMESVLLVKQSNEYCDYTNHQPEKDWLEFSEAKFQNKSNFIDVLLIYSKNKKKENLTYKDFLFRIL